MNYDENLKIILQKEKRWTPKAFEKFGVLSDSLKLKIPLWPSDVYRTYDFNKSDKKERLSNPKGTKVSLFGNLAFDELILLEGEWDLFAAFEVGIENIFTLTNGANSFNEVLASKVSGKIINIIYDLDEAGNAGSEKAAEFLKNSGCKVRIIKLPLLVGNGGDVRDLITNYAYSKNDILELISESDFFQTALEKQIQKNVSKLSCMADLQEKEPEFLWKPYIAKGFVTLLTGDPGIGKSTITAILASVVSNGSIFWDNSQCEVGKVVILNIEDPLKEVLLPRLNKASANCSKVFAYDHKLELNEEGQSTIREFIKTHQPILFIIDPIVAYIGADTDTNRANEVRDKMSFLSLIADEFKVAILVVRHMTKGTQSKLIFSGHGSIDFIASARSEVMFTIDPENSNKRYFGHTKSNLTKLGSTIKFEMTESGPQVEEIIETPLAQILDNIEQSKKKSNINIEDLIEKIRMILGDRPMMVINFFEELEIIGFSEKSVKRVIKTLDSEFKSVRINFSKKKAGQGRWIIGKLDHVKALKQQKFDLLEELEKKLEEFEFQEGQNNCFYEPNSNIDEVSQ